MPSNFPTNLARISEGKLKNLVLLANPCEAICIVRQKISYGPETSSGLETGVGDQITNYCTSSMAGKYRAKPSPVIMGLAANVIFNKRACRVEDRHEKSSPITCCPWSKICLWLYHEWLGGGSDKWSNYTELHNWWSSINELWNTINNYEAS